MKRVGKYVDIKGYLLNDDLTRCGYNKSQLCAEFGFSKGVIGNSLCRDRMDLDFLKFLAERCGQPYTKYVLGEIDCEKRFNGLSLDDKMRALTTDKLIELQMRIAIELHNRANATKRAKKKLYKESK